MKTREEAREACRVCIESALRNYAADTGIVTMPIVEDWVAVATFSDLDAEAGNGKWMHIRPKNSWSHRAVGLLTIAADDLRGLVAEEGD